MAELRQNVILGDGLAGLATLEPGSARLVLSDLPSGETQAGFDRPPSWPNFWSAVWQALADDGIAVLMASRIQFAAEMIASQPRAFRYDIVWHKSIAVGVLNAKLRPLRAHEFLMIFSRRTGTYNAQMSEGHEANRATRRQNSRSENYGAPGAIVGDARTGATTRFPRSVLEVPSLANNSKKRIHPQQKPVDLLRWCVRTYSNRNDLVVDPYSGSGSTGVAAESEGRRFLGWDTDPRFGFQTRKAASE